MHPESSWFIIVNPAAGGGTGGRAWRGIEALLKGMDIPYTAAESKYAGHIPVLTAEALGRGFRKIAGVGGDGTVCAMVNGIFGQTAVDPAAVTLGLIPVGMGNDWRRSMGIPVDRVRAVQVLADENTGLCDVGIVSCEGCAGRYFVNMAGVGLDAAVVRNTGWMRKIPLFRKALYHAGLLLTTVRYQSTDVSLAPDNRYLRNAVLSLNVAIGRYNGGGMLQAPDAVINDGLFDLTVYNDMGLTEIVRNIRRLYDGTIADHPKVRLDRAARIVVHSDPPVLVEVDGDMVGYTPATFTVADKKLRVVCAE